MGNCLPNRPARKGRQDRDPGDENMDTNSTDSPGACWEVQQSPGFLASVPFVSLSFISNDAAAAADMVVSRPRCPFSLYSEGLSERSRRHRG